MEALREAWPIIHFLLLLVVGLIAFSARREMTLQGAHNDKMWEEIKSLYKRINQAETAFKDHQLNCMGTYAKIGDVVRIEAKIDALPHQLGSEMRRMVHDAVKPVEDKIDFFHPDYGRRKNDRPREE